jgi:DNA-binding response OmpR family regulator
MVGIVGLMLSLKTNIVYPFVKEEPRLEICPHCGGNLKHDPDDTFNFEMHQIRIKSPRSGVVWIRSVPPKTWSVLEFLLKHIGQFRSTERVHIACFSEEVDTGIVTVQVGALRKLLQGSPYEIETKYAIGYRLLRKN